MDEEMAERAVLLEELSSGCGTVAARVAVRQDLARSHASDHTNIRARRLKLPLQKCPIYYSTASSNYVPPVYAAPVPAAARAVSASSNSASDSGTPLADSSTPNKSAAGKNASEDGPTYHEVPELARRAFEACRGVADHVLALAYEALLCGVWCGGDGGGDERAPAEERQTWTRTAFRTSHGSSSPPAAAIADSSFFWLSVTSSRYIFSSFWYLRVEKDEGGWRGDGVRYEPLDDAGFDFELSPCRCYVAHYSQ